MEFQSILMKTRRKQLLSQLHRQAIARVIRLVYSQRSKQCVSNLYLYARPANAGKRGCVLYYRRSSIILILIPLHS